MKRDLRRHYAAIILRGMTRINPAYTAVRAALLALKTAKLRKLAKAVAKARKENGN